MFFPLSPPSTCPPAITKNGALFLAFHLLDDGRGVINDGYARSAKKKTWECTLEDWSLLAERIAGTASVLALRIRGAQL